VMFNMKRSLVMLSLLLYQATAFAGGFPLDDEQVRQLLINDSIRTFPGNCPCPYSLKQKKTCFGKRCKVRPCGGRSAWSMTPLGYPSPLCFRTDVSDEMIFQFRQGG